MAVRRKSMPCCGIRAWPRLRRLPAFYNQPILSAQPPLGFSFVANTTAAVTMDAEQINIISLALADLSERVQDLRGYL